VVPKKMLLPMQEDRCCGRLQQKWWY
jgi:hypothetical protein